MTNTPNTDRILALAKTNADVAQALEALLTDTLDLAITDEDFPENFVAPCDSLVALQEAVEAAEG